MAGMEHSQGGQAPQESMVHVFDSESNISTARVCENGFCDSLEGAVRGHCSSQSSGANLREVPDT